MKANNCFITKSKKKMKKLVLMLAVAFSMSFVACGNKEAATETTAAEETVEVVAEETVAPAADSTVAAVDSTVAAADSTVAAN